MKDQANSSVTQHEHGASYHVLGIPGQRSAKPMRHMTMTTEVTEAKQRNVARVLFHSTVDGDVA